jgi:hypothetical protein
MLFFLLPNQRTPTGGLHSPSYIRTIKLELDKPFSNHLAHYLDTWSKVNVLEGEMIRISRWNNRHSQQREFYGEGNEVDTS